MYFGSVNVKLFFYAKIVYVQCVPGPILFAKNFPKIVCQFREFCQIS